MRRPIKLAAMLAVILLVAVALRFILPADIFRFAAKSPDQQRASDAPSNQNKADGKGQNTGKQKGPVSVLAAAAQAENVPIIVRGIGNVAAFNAVSVKSRVDGNIVKIFYDEGKWLRVNDPLVQIDPRPYQAMLDQANGNTAKDQANLDNARRDLERVSALLQTQLAATRQQYDTQKSLVAQLEAAVKSDQAAVEAAKLNLDYTLIRSPIEGVAGLQLVAIGNLVQAGAATPLVEIQQVKPIAVIFTVPERYLDNIRQQAAQKRLRVLAFNGDDDRQLADGELLVINNQVDQTTGTITLKASFPNATAALWPGEFVNAHLVLKVVENGVTVAPGAVQMGPSGSFVYVIKPDSTVQARPVTVEQVEGNRALIGKGLAAGEKIVVSGQSGLSDGATVAVQHGKPGDMNAQEPEIGPQGVGSTGINTAPAGAGGITPR